MVSTIGEDKVHHAPGPQTVFKLSTLRQYLPRMIYKILSNRDASLTLVDGFAGNGYAGDRSGSTRIMVEEVHKRITKTQYNNDCSRIKIIAVEKEFNRYNQLLSLKREYQNINLDLRNEPIEDCLPDIVSNNKGGLFVFLDPYGLQIPFNIIRDAFHDRLTMTSEHTPPTELLLNVSSEGLWRAAGHVDHPNFQPRKIAKMFGSEDWMSYCDQNLQGDGLAEALTEYYVKQRLTPIGFADSLIYPVHCNRDTNKASNIALPFSQ